MFTIILKILSILGILLLVILGTVLVLLLLVLFVPLTYRIWADRKPAAQPQETGADAGERKSGKPGVGLNKQGAGLNEPSAGLESGTESEPGKPQDGLVAGGMLDGVHITAKADWLLGLLRVRFLYPEPGTVKVKVLCFTVFDSGAAGTGGQETDDIGSAGEDGSKGAQKRQENVRPQKATQDRSKKEKAEAGADRQSETEEQAGAEAGSGADARTESGMVAESGTGGQFSGAETQAAPGTEARTEEAAPESEARGESRAGCGREASGQRNIPRQSIPDKIKYTFRKICDKIKAVCDKIKEIAGNIAYYKEILLCEDTKSLVHHAFLRLGKILKSIRPRRLRADIRFGFDSPDITGYVFGIYGMLCAYLGKNVILTPDFEQAVLEGELYAAGHITVFQIVWHLLRLALDKKLWELLSRLREREKGK